MLTILHHQDLTSLNTFHLSAQATNYCRLDNLSQLPAIREQLANFSSHLVLGGGSNILLPERYDGLVIHNHLRGISFEQQADAIMVTAAAGEIWDDLVDSTLAHGAFGLENLSLIPGSVGAAPVQNIGAYGVEVKDFIEYVTVYDLTSGQTLDIPKSACGFAYSNIIFKTKPNYVVVSVTFRLSAIPQLKLSYADLAKAFADQANPTPAQVRQAVISIRRNKLPDSAQIGNVGSFFHNPLIPDAAAEKLASNFPGLPVYPADKAGHKKVSAGWLIDKLGLKGYRQGNIAVYDKQALVLVNHASATQQELLVFAHEIQAKVLAAYGVSINIEPIIVK